LSDEVLSGSKKSWFQDKVLVYGWACLALLLIGGSFYFWDLVQKECPIPTAYNFTGVVPLHFNKTLSGVLNITFVNQENEPIMLSKITVLNNTEEVVKEDFIQTPIDVNSSFNFVLDGLVTAQDECDVTLVKVEYVLVSSAKPRVSSGVLRIEAT